MKCLGPLVGLLVASLSLADTKNECSSDIFKLVGGDRKANLVACGVFRAMEQRELKEYVVVVKDYLIKTEGKEYLTLEFFPKKMSKRQKPILSVTGFGNEIVQFNISSTGKPEWLFIKDLDGDGREEIGFSVAASATEKKLALFFLSVNPDKKTIVSVVPAKFEAQKKEVLLEFISAKNLFLVDLHERNAAKGSTPVTRLQYVGFDSKEPLELKL